MSSEAAPKAPQLSKNPPVNMLKFSYSSAFAKRYASEEGADTVVQRCNGTAEIAISKIAPPELISACCRIGLATKISETQYHQLKDSPLADIGGAAIYDLAPILLADPIASLERNTLRTMDVIHNGSAVEVQANLFASTDARQCASVGLQVVAV